MSGWVEVADLHRLTGPGEVPHASSALRSKSLVDVPGPADEHQPAALLPSTDAGVGDGLHTGGVDLLELAQVEHHEPYLQPGLVQCPL